MSKSSDRTVTAAGLIHSDFPYSEVLKQHTRLSKVLPKNKEPNLFFHFLHFVALCNSTKQSQSKQLFQSNNTSRSKL